MTGPRKRTFPLALATAVGALVAGPAHSSKTGRLENPGDAQAKKNYSITVNRETADHTKHHTETDQSRSGIGQTGQRDRRTGGGLTTSRYPGNRSTSARETLPTVGGNGRISERPAARLSSRSYPDSSQDSRSLLLAFAPTSSSRQIEEALRRRKAIQKGPRRSAAPGAGSESNPQTPVNNEDMIREALAHRGARYVWGGASRGGFDCSGFALYVYERTRGIKLPHSAAAQMKHGTPVARKDLRPGDLVFFFGRGTIGHVGIYIGRNRFVHAASHKGQVRTDALEGYYHQRYAGARRLSPAPEFASDEDQPPHGTTAAGGEDG